MTIAALQRTIATAILASMENVLRIPAKMSAVLLTGHGGFEKLEYREDVPVPQPQAAEVLIKVAASSINNTDINTRIGWYGDNADNAEGGWAGAIAFPRIQGADICGHVVAVGEGVSPTRIGERVVVQGCLVSRRSGDTSPWIGSEQDGGFAQFACAPNDDTHTVNSQLGDAELAALPCAYGTAANLLEKAALQPGETVLVTGASGNVGLAAVQLAKLADATVAAIAAKDKHTALAALGADHLIDRAQSPVAAFGKDRFDVVLDLVGGPGWPDLLEALRPGGRYAVAGAIAGPHVSLDLRKLYLKDLTLLGCTTQSRETFLAMLGHASAGRLKPPVAARYALRDMVEAQKAFLSKQHVGKLVIVPPAVKVD
jgi:NADPH:quinone reductase-like Zn-dependent oxidoreductase